MSAVVTDQDRERYRAVVARERRFDGMFVTGVRTTGIYCRPSCPARTPKMENVEFFATAAAAHGAGYRACRRCRPDAVPGTPEWDIRADAVARAMRLIRDGVVEREGVAGLANHLGYSVRQVHRLVMAEMGAGPLAIARAQRAHTARVLIETTTMPFGQVAHAAGFRSQRQFNETIQEMYGQTPTQLRQGRGERVDPGEGLTLSCAVREPFDGAHLADYFAGRAIEGVEEVRDGIYRRAVVGPAGLAWIAVDLRSTPVRVQVRGALGDLHEIVRGVRRTFDLDADPVAVDAVLSREPGFVDSVRHRPGLRVPGQIDGFEIAVRAVVGQQISVKRARTVLSRISRTFGSPVTSPDGDPWLLFPLPETIADADPTGFSMPRRRGAALCALAEAVARGAIDLTPGADRDETRRQLEEIPGIGPWTSGYIAMRALRDPDAVPHNDLVMRRVCTRIGVPQSLDTVRPWRAYAAMHTWTMARERNLS